MDIVEVIKSYNRVHKCDILLEINRIFLLYTDFVTLLSLAMPQEVKIHSVQQTSILSKS